jgi:hypothetical protein
VTTEAVFHGFPDDRASIFSEFPVIDGRTVRHERLCHDCEERGWRNPPYGNADAALRARFIRLEVHWNLISVRMHILGVPLDYPFVPETMSTDLLEAKSDSVSPDA